MSKTTLSHNPADRIDNLVSSVRRFNRFYPRRIGVISHRLLGTEFSLAEAQLMFEMNYSRMLSVSDLAHKLGVDRGYMSRLTSSLEKRHFVKRLKSDSDGRVRLLNLTQKGKEALSILEQRSSTLVRQFLETLTQDNQAKLVSAMDTIQDIMQPRSARGKSIVLRSHRSGDLGWIIERHGAIYNRDYEFDLSFEVLIAEIVAKLTKKFNSMKEQIWIAEIDGERVGSIALAKANRSTARLRLFFVEPWARGNGVGKALLKECIRFAREAGYKDIILWTLNILKVAEQLYKTAGFRVMSEEKLKRFGRNLVSQIYKLEFK